MLKVTHDTGGQYDCDMLILCVKVIFQVLRQKFLVNFLYILQS